MSSNGVLSTTDLVLNHTADNSTWLHTDPEGGYSEYTHPHLIGAIELDNALMKFSDDLVNGNYQSSYGINKNINDEDNLNKVCIALEQKCISPFKLREWFEVDYDRCVKDFEHARNSGTCAIDRGDRGDRFNKLKLELQKTIGERRKGVHGDGVRLASLCVDVGELRHMIQACEKDFVALADHESGRIPEKIKGGIRYERLEQRKGPVGKDKQNRLYPTYFTEVVDKNGKTHHVANNGWVMGWDASADFAAAGSLVYITRELVCWADCVKLNFGSKEEDNPNLWNLMRRYCEEAAEMFHGVRLDNCHSTPIHVAEYMLQAARKIRPQLWVYAELFTGDHTKDRVFEVQLGLNSLIREAMQTSNPLDLAYHIDAYSGKGIGSLSPCLCEDRVSHPNRRVLLSTPSIPLFFDCTHDNPTPAERRTPHDALANAAAVAASVCSIGSTRGYDELVPHNISVVHERRLHQTYEFGQKEKENENKTNKEKEDEIKSFDLMWDSPNAQTVEIRGSFNNWGPGISMHKGVGGKFQVKLVVGDNIPKDIKEFTFKFVINNKSWEIDRNLPLSRDSNGNENNFISVDNPISAPMIGGVPGIMQAKKLLNEIHIKLAVEEYSEVSSCVCGSDVIVVRRFKPLDGKLCYFILRSAFWGGGGRVPDATDIKLDGSVTACLLAASLHVPQDAVHLFRQDNKIINGLYSKLEMHNSVSWMGQLLDNNKLIRLHNFPPGSCLVVLCDPINTVTQSDVLIKELVDITSTVELEELSYLVFSCENEERDRSKGNRGLYDIQDQGPMKYGGIGGCVSWLNKARLSLVSTWGDPSPVIKNVMDGTWLLQYYAGRLDDAGATRPNLRRVKEWLLKCVSLCESTPSWLRAQIFDKLIGTLYGNLRLHALNKMGKFVKNSKDPLVQDLAFATLQFYSYTPSSPLIWGTTHPSLCAGLPHFSTEYMRNWGRDTFISLPGCLLVTERFNEAHEEILGFGRVVRHGLVPNLLDSGNNPRYNARDATWFFLQAIQYFCSFAPKEESKRLLTANVELKYEGDGVPSNVSVLGLVVHILQQHAKGIGFREWNAGNKIDEHMKDNGFDVKSVCDLSVGGLLVGGNRDNCGTWMDKMGSSSKARNKGLPATPRDGGPSEINGMLCSTLTWLASIEPTEYSELKGLKFEGRTVEEWRKSACDGFHEQYSFKTNDGKYSYKDTIKSAVPDCDLQMRPNICIAMAVAPQCFNKEYCLSYLDRVCDELLEPKSLGLKTLSVKDKHFRPNYNNADDSEDMYVAHGFNYHNGPEWVWPLGLFLIAKNNFSRFDRSKEGIQKSRRDMCKHLLEHRRHMREDPWMSLPEITDTNGRPCYYGCPAQAWSIATPLLFLHTLETSTPAPPSKSPPAKAPPPPKAPQVPKEDPPSKAIPTVEVQKMDNTPPLNSPPVMATPPNTQSPTPKPL
eukprot:GHVR01025476.1.p1 GENE.GHVR01025476.1~~GHVR01025476.1.p1  ORF type:complete len:1429 (+),score=377.13 GHVR01025476.1:323-4609(+)